MILPKKNDKEALKVKYGVIKEIPKQPIEESVVEEKIQKQTVVNKDTLDLILRLEKLEGKFSAFEDVKDDINERIARLSEEIGELRSSFLELDKNFNSLEAKAEKVLDAVKELQPEKFSKELQKKDAEILKMQAEIESLKNVFSKIKNDNERLSSLLEKIKNIENLITMYKKLSEKIQLIDDTKVYVDRLAGKSETIFSEMESKMKDVEYMKTKLQKLDDLTVDFVKMLDSVSLKIPKLIEKDSAQKLVEEMVKKNMSDLSKNYLNDLKSIVEQTKTEAVKQIEEEKKKLLNNLNEVSNLLSSFKVYQANANIDEKMETYFRFMQTLNMLNIASDKEEVLYLINLANNLRSKMMQLNIWTNEKENYFLKTLYYLDYFWEYNGNNEIKQIFDEQIKNLTR